MVLLLLIEKNIFTNKISYCCDTIVSEPTKLISPMDQFNLHIIFEISYPLQSIGQPN